MRRKSNRVKNKSNIYKVSVKKFFIIITCISTNLKKKPTKTLKMFFSVKFEPKNENASFNWRWLELESKEKALPTLYQIDCYLYFVNMGLMTTLTNGTDLLSR